MGVFNIDFNKYKPSNSLPTRNLNPVATPLQSTPTTSRTSSPAPAPLAEPVQEKKSGLQKVFDVLSYPSKITEKVLTGGKGYEAAYSNPESGLRKFDKYFMDLPSTLISKGLGVKSPTERAYEDPRSVKFVSEASRFALDPLNVVPFGAGGKILNKAGKFISKATGIGKTVNKAVEFAKSTPKLYKAIEVINPYFRNPEFGKVIQATEKVTGSRINNLYRELKTMTTGLTPEDQVHIGEIVEGIVKPKNAKFGQVANRVKEITEQIGKEAVDSGLLTKESFDKMTKQGYLSHIESLIPNAEKGIGQVKEVPRSFANQFKKRTGELENYVKEFAPVVYKGLGSEIKAIETAKMFKDVAVKFGKKIGKGADALPGFVRASEIGIEGRNFAKAFRGIQIPKEVAEYIMRSKKINTPNAYEKLIGAWKAGKTIFNPAYHVRNVISNQILSSMGTGKNLVSTVSDYIKAVREYKAGTSSLFKVAQDAGIVGRKSFGTGLNELLDTAGLTKQTILQKIGSKPRDLQNLTEETSKLNVFRSWMEKLAKESGIGLEDALQNKELVDQAVNKAEEAIFSPYRISQTERSAIGKYVPFYSFTRQALPFTAKTLVNNPKSIAVFGKIKSAIEGLSEDPNIELPDYMKNQIRLSNKNGKVTYFDPSYIYPFGNFLENGLGRGQLPFGLSFDPFAMEVVQQLANTDFYFGNQIAKSNLTSKAVGQRLAHLYRTASPAALTTLTNTIWPALIQKKDYQGRTRSIGQAILTALGIKVNSPDIQNIQVQNLRSKNAKKSSVQQEIDQVVNDPNMPRSKKDEQIRELQKQL